MFNFSRNDKKAEILMVDFVGLEKTVKVLSYAKGLAKLSGNPLAVAISLLDERIEVAQVKKIKEFSDFGVLGEISGEEVILGIEKVMNEQNIKVNGDANNKVFFAINNEVQAVFKFKEI